jgi:hypothetical protein
MDVFDLRGRLVADYQSYTRSFIKIRDTRIGSFVDNALRAGAFWPEPLLQLNPTFLPGGTIDDAARIAPVGVTRYDKPFVVVMAVEKYERLTERKCKEALEGCQSEGSDHV